MSLSTGQSMSKQREAAELRKVHAEARLAEWQNTRLGRLTRYNVLVTTLVAVAAVCWTIYGGRSQEERTRDHFVETRISDAAEKLFKFDNVGPPPPGQVKFLLDELQKYLSKLPNADEAEVARRKQLISNQLVAAVKDGDFDYKKNRHLDFELQALDSWPAYKETLKQQAGDNLYILDKYLRALKSLHDEDPAFVETVTQNEKRITHLSVRPKNEAMPFLLEKLARGCQVHSSLLKGGPDAASYNRAICQFYRATNNRGFAAGVLGQDGLSTCD